MLGRRTSGDSKASCSRGELGGSVKRPRPSGHPGERIHSLCQLAALRTGHVMQNLRRWS